jgi:hypothetical protein
VSSSAACVVGMGLLGVGVESCLVRSVAELERGVRVVGMGAGSDAGTCLKIKLQPARYEVLTKTRVRKHTRARAQGQKWFSVDLYDTSRVAHNNELKLKAISLRVNF